MYRSITLVLAVTALVVSSVSAFQPLLQHQRRLSLPTRYQTEQDVSDATSNSDNGVGDSSQAIASLDYEGRLAGLEGRPNYRCGFVAVVGAPNMGKSTLLNALLQEDLCIATARPQTTRHAILGLLTTEDCQVCIVDTPGVIDVPAYKLQENMMEAVTGALKDADVFLVVTDLFSTPISNDAIFQRVVLSQKPTIVVINKIDLANKVNRDAPENSDKTVTVEQAVAMWRSLLPHATVILPVCAADGPDEFGVTALRQILTGGPDVPAAMRNLGRPIPGMFASEDVKFMTNEQAKALLPLSPPLYDTDSLTDRNMRFVVSELIRATLFELLNKELPYCCEVRITQYREPRGPKEIVRIEADVVVERDSQKVIVVGKGGAQIKDIGTKAREKIEDFLQEQIFLKLNVVVNKDWRKREEVLKQYGYTN